MSAALFARALPRGGPVPRDRPPYDDDFPGPRLMGGPDRERERDFGFPGRFDRLPGPDGPMGGPMQPPMLPPPFVVDREKTCPLLIRVFKSLNRHHTLADFAVRGKEPQGEIQIYTWLDATLRELSDLIKEVEKEARGRNTRMSFAFVYPDRRGRNVMRQVGLVHSTRGGEDDRKTLKQLNFQTGDFLDVAIIGV